MLRRGLLHSARLWSIMLVAIGPRVVTVGFGRRLGANGRNQGKEIQTAGAPPPLGLESRCMDAHHVFLGSIYSAKARQDGSTGAEDTS